jgi:DNA-binding NarL/FixJ family response regulator
VGGRSRPVVLVVSPHELVLCGMQLVLGAQTWVARVLTAQDPGRAILAARRHRPDVALLHAGVLGGSAERLCRALRGAAPGVRTLLLAPGGAVTSRTVAGAGAWGTVALDGPAGAIADAVRAAGAGRVPGRPPAAAAAAGAGLSGRQREVLRLLAAGATNDEIARALHLSPNTVKQHASALYRKLAVRNRVEAIGRAQALGLLT